jgi:hypothetical protein
MKKKLILIVPTFVLGAALGWVGAFHVSSSLHREIRSVTRIAEDIRLATRSAASAGVDLPLSDALEDIPRRTLNAHAKSKNGQTAQVRKMNAEVLPFSKAFYIYTEREIPKDLDRVLADIDPISRDEFLTLVGHIGSQTR